MKTILYATDYSKNSVAALKYAQKLSAQLQSRLVVTFVLAYPIVSERVLVADLPEIRKNNIKMARKQLEDFCKEHLNEQWKTMNIQIAPVENMVVVDGIMALANDWHAEMIVVGTKGANPIEEVLLGSTTSRLIKKAACPVLAIPADTSYRLPETIVYATDFEEEDVYAIKKVTEIAEAFDAEIKIVHIATKNKRSSETLMDRFKNRVDEKVEYNRLRYELLNSEDIISALRAYLITSEAHLLVMLERKKYGFLKKWFSVDKVKMMESYGQLPLLSFNEANLNILRFSLD
jgi:nucleotide-binding universal stress UspA family protein